MKKQIHLFIFGLVQGVFFRSSASQEARRLKLVGFVRNCDDRSVEVVAEGEAPALEKMIEWCRKGPSGAHVEQVEIEWKETTRRFVDFKIC